MFNNSGWSYSTSSGVGLTIGELAEVTVQHARIYVTSPNGDTRKIIAQGVGGGVGASILPASITGSTTDFVSAGTNIYSVFNQTISIADLSDMLLIYSGNLTWLTGDGSGSLVLFLHNTSIWQFAYGLIPIAGPAIMASQVLKAFCLVAAAQMSTPNLGADATGTFYSVLSADVV
ncbi:MAG: hypothetical protein JST47_13350 [Bacteroidetes bacterium]|nr:hypothetical protein [Bacteroidota bacterium]MBS1974020.1 hypothetical protein [Bacteroidota bacterium]